MSVSLPEAWLHWLSGVDLNGYILWGLQIRTWARIGKLLQFLAGLVVVLDLVGPKRLRSFARRIGAHGLHEARRRAAHARERVTRILEISHEIRSQELKIPRRRSFESMTRTQREAVKSMNALSKENEALIGPVLVFRTIGFLVACGLAAGLLFIIPDWKAIHAADLPDWMRYVVFAVVMISVKPISRASRPALDLLLIKTAVFARNTYALLVYCVSYPIVAILDVSKPGYSLRWLALVLLIVGFHFDLLGS